MKCRRSSASRGARLRNRTNGAAPPTPAAHEHRRGALANNSTANTWPDPGSVLRIDGQTEGSIHYSGTVTVGPHGALIGDVHATAVVVEGALTGNVYAANSLHLAATATMVGDMHSPRIAVARGAQVRGNITMRPSLSPPADLDELTVDTLLSGGRQA